MSLQLAHRGDRSAGARAGLLALSATLTLACGCELYDAQLLERRDGITIGDAGDDVDSGLDDAGPNRDRDGSQGGDQDGGRDGGDELRDAGERDAASDSRDGDVEDADRPDDVSDSGVSDASQPPDAACGSPCDDLPNVQASSCPESSCRIDSCAQGWADCDEETENGCEHELGVLGPCDPELKRITIDPSFVLAPLTDFPVLVRIADDAALMSARADGSDLFFSSDGGPASGATALAFEIERWDQESGDLIAWVRIPSISDSDDTVFYLRYGDGLDYSAYNTPSDVWDAEFESVQHFTSGLDDSTANALEASDQGSTPDQAGQIAGGRAFPGNAYIAMGEAGALPDEDRYTLSAWVNVSLFGGDMYKYVMASSQPTAPFSGMAFGVRQSDGAVTAHVDGDFRSASDHVVAGGTWVFVAVRYLVASADGLFESSVDGEPFTTVYSGDTEDARNVATSPFQIGRWSGGDYYYDGSIDELRVSSSHRDDAWIHAEYENQRSGSTFLRIETP